MLQVHEPQIGFDGNRRPATAGGVGFLEVLQRQDHPRVHRILANSFGILRIGSGNKASHSVSWPFSIFNISTTKKGLLSGRIQKTRNSPTHSLLSRPSQFSGGSLRFLFFLPKPGFLGSTNYNKYLHPI